MIVLNVFQGVNAMNTAADPSISSLSSTYQWSSVSVSLGCDSDVHERIQQTTAEQVNPVWFLYVRLVS